MIHLTQLEQDFDDQRARTVLAVDVGSISTPIETVTKSLYNFSLDTPDGLANLVELLPIVSKEILTSVYKELFMGYPAEDLSSRQMAMELKGFLLDVLLETEDIDEK